jgi:hypothetical protein
MKRTSIRPAGFVIMALIVLVAVLIMQAQGMADYVQHALAVQAGSLATPRGPEADPSLRHAPGGYDYELEPPPADMP